MQKVPTDTPQYLAEITKFKNLMGFDSWEEAERELMPIRAAKRQIAEVQS